ncbi:c-factor [Trichonephila clavipes]|nr:c-factor [Trichonephila clavipes]
MGCCTDVTKLQDIKAAAKLVQDKVGIRGLNLLINNAGYAKLQGFPEVTEESFFTHFHTNTVGPFMVLQEFLPLLKKAADRSEGTKMSVSRSAVVNISAGNGSITTATFDFPVIHAAVGYRVSKAASNMAMRMIAPALTKSGILDIQMCPGWVKTDMGSPAAELECSDSIAAMLNTMEGLNESHQGAFIDRNGEAIPF